MNHLICPSRLRTISGYPWRGLSGRDVRALRLEAGLSIDQAAAWLGRHRTSVVRLEAGHTRVSLSTVHLLLLLGGALPFAPWAGWRIEHDTLTSPSVKTAHYTPGELDLVTFAWQTADAARAELRRLGVGEDDIARRVPRYRRAA